MKTRLTSNLLFGLAAASILAVPAMAQEAETASKGPEVKFSGEVEFDAYTGDVVNEDKKSHNYASTFDLNVDVKFNEKWSASVQLEADGETTDPTAIYNGAFVQYTHSDKFAVKFGDLTFSEGAFLNFYDYDDPADNAAGMAEHDIRGFEIDYDGLVFGLGFGRGGNDNQVCVEEDGEEKCVGVAYDLHLAYELGLGEQVLRPFVDYKSYQEAEHNELHAGLDANLKADVFTFHFVYGLHMDNLGEDTPKATHAFLAEPAVELGKVNIKGSVFYAIIDKDDPTDHGEEIPEYFFAYGEPSVKINDAIANTTDKDEDVSVFNIGLRAYFTPIEGLDVTGFAKVNIPVGDDADDAGLKFGLETVFAF